MIISTPRLINFLALSAFIFLPAISAFCSDDSHASGHGSLADLGIYWVNFLIYITALFFLLRGKVAAGWIARRDKIESDVTGGRIEIEAAENKIAVMRSRMDTIGEDIERVRETTEKETERESSEIVQGAQTRAQRISQRMRDSCSAEQRSAETEIRREIAETALKLAREQIMREVSAESDQAFRKAVIEKAGRLLQ